VGEADGLGPRLARSQGGVVFNPPAVANRAIPGTHSHRPCSGPFGSPLIPDQMYLAVLSHVQRERNVLISEGTRVG